LGRVCWAMTEEDETPVNFDEYLQRWQLTPDGEPIQTQSSRLLPVRRGDEPAMLKISHVVEERRGPHIMRWWDGVGAARVLAFDGDAVLLERATGTRSLNARAKSGDDDGATRILCDAVMKLHEPRSAPLPEQLIPLNLWFQELAPAAERFGGILRLSDVVARELLAEPRDQVPLHGDIHHDNILDFGERGWLAIDPKGLYGERGFDYGNIFTNPVESDLPTEPGVLQRRLEIILEMTGMERERMLRWIVAWCGLSAAWILLDGAGVDHEAAQALAVARIAARELDLG
jgi:streptomycin 6-kinase